MVAVSIRAFTKSDVRSVLLLFWHQQRLVHDIVFHLNDQNLPTLQRSLSTIAELLVHLSGGFFMSFQVVDADSSDKNAKF